MLHYNPRRVSSINMPIFRRTNCIITASGIVTLEISERSDINEIKSNKMRSAVSLKQFVFLSLQPIVVVFSQPGSVL